MRRLTLLFVVIVLFLPQAAFAWNDTGHMIVAELAWRQLTDAQKQELAAILKNHPHYKLYLSADAPAGADLNEWVFLRAATWPDWVRPARPGNKSDTYKDATITQYHHGPWHYIDLPYVLNSPTSRPITPAEEPSKEGDILTALDANKAVFINSTAKLQDRAIALAWILHLIGDIHQPLHATTMYSARFPNGDKGGNDQEIRTELGASNLHAFWDDLLGTANNYKAINFLASDIANDPRDDVSKQKDYADHKTFKSWAQESHDYAVSMVYLDGRLNSALFNDYIKHNISFLDVPALPAMYSANARDLARLRVSLAGARLADTLHEIAK